ncbi:MAG: preprotein translocase subunit SecE [Lachnospira sp.]|nr:preprotein translocase subunit SecE [Lachnospira sp.]
MSETNEKVETKKKKKGFFKGLKAEFGKIVWPNKVTLAKETISVIVVSVLLGAMIMVLDFIIEYGVDFLVNLKF